MAVDNDEVDFETIGDQQTLDLGGPMYVGSVGQSLAVYSGQRVPKQWIPPNLWSATLRDGFVGCMRDLVINGLSIDIAEFARKQDSGNTLYIAIVP